MKLHNWRGGVQDLWGEIVDLDFPVPTCGNLNGDGDPCKLPSGHESADIPHIWTADPPGKFRTITRVSDRDRTTDNVECGE